MTTYISVEACTINDLSYSGSYSHDRGTEIITVSDGLINEDSIAKERAIFELINGGYSQRTVNITSVHILNLKQNDLIMFKGYVWIVKEVTLSFTAPTLIQKIKGVRYE